jgi:pimeloyl-ACP methyl ester carboxylesterase
MGQALACRWITPAGCDERPVIVFLHDALGSIGQWKDFPDELCAVARTRGFVFDRIGYGHSPPLTGPRTVDYLREQGEQWLPEVLRAAGIDRPILFGHSDGGSIALYYAALEAPRALVSEAAHVFVEDVTRDGIRAFAERWRTTDVAMRLARYHGDKAEAVFRTWHDTWLTEAFGAFDMIARLPRITCPSLVIQGEHDPYGSAAQVEAILRGIGPAARAWILPGLGHAPHLEEKERVAREVAAFLHDGVE